MSGWLRRNPLIAALTLLAAALLVVLATEVGLDSRTPPAAPAKAGTTVEARLLPPLQAVTPEQAYAETTTRPLFVPTRRPAPDLAVATAPAFQRGQFTLQGVIIAGGTRTAMLREKSSGRIHRVEAGREINGVKIVQIDPHVVTLGLGDERETVPLVVQRPGAGTAAGALPAPAAAAMQGPFAGQAPAPPDRPVTQQPPVPPGGQPLTAGGPAFPTGPGQAPAGGPAIAAPGTAQPAAEPMSPEELLARRRARRAQQNQ
jgi:general secretion pathway protein N